MEDKASSADVFGYSSEIVECPTGNDPYFI
jgi:hypothetical protein